MIIKELLLWGCHPKEFARQSPFCCKVLFPRVKVRFRYCNEFGFWSIFPALGNVLQLFLYRMVVSLQKTASVERK